LESETDAGGREGNIGRVMYCQKKTRKKLRSRRLQRIIPIFECYSSAGDGNIDCKENEVECITINSIRSDFCARSKPETSLSYHL